MATTLKNFFVNTVACLIGSAVKAANTVAVYDPPTIAELSGKAADKVDFDFSTDSYALHGACVKALSGTTKISIDLTNLATGTNSSAGDATFATWNKLVIRNLGTGSATFTIAPGSANPANGIAGGTTPTITLQAGGVYAIEDPTGNTVDSTHKIIDITPTADGLVSVAVAGA